MYLTVDALLARCCNEELDLAKGVVLLFIVEFLFFELVEAWATFFNEVLVALL